MHVHRSGGSGYPPSLMSRKAVGRRVGVTIKVKERVASRVAERVVNRAAAFVPDNAFVERDRVGFGGTIGWE